MLCIFGRELFILKKIAFNFMICNINFYFIIHSFKLWIMKTRPICKRAFGNRLQRKETVRCLLNFLKIE